MGRAGFNGLGCAAGPLATRPPDLASRSEALAQAVRDAPPASQDLAAVEMFRSLPREAIADLAGRCRLRHFDAGEIVFDEGERGESLFVVREGLLKVVRPTRGRSLVLDRLGLGRAFGELAVLNSSPRLASVIAVEPSATLEIHKADLEAVFDAHPLACSDRSRAR